ncbi:MAG TPA: SGNH/GDSL hydrolase family protein [Bacteroidetes bacterium]|nr:SGNH/GDSL hydrolase family protein [Bacteroidota bacterium]
MTDPVRLALAPVLLWQGRRLFQTIPRLPEPEGDRHGMMGEGPGLRLLVVGDSSGAGVGVDTQTEALLGRTVARLAERFRVTYRLEARHGSTIPRTLRHLRKQDPEPFDVALLGVGLNDVIAGRALGPWLQSYSDLADDLRQRFGVGHLVVSGLPPIGEFPAVPQPLRWVLGRTARRHDRALREWASTQPEATFIDFETVPGDPLHGVPMREVMATDGFHPGPRIYDEWGRRAAEAIAHATG